MLRESTGTNHLSAAVLEPELVAEAKKAEMKQAIVERFCYRVKADTQKVTRQTRSPYWQPVDEEC